MIDAVTLGVVRFLVKCDADRTRGAEPAVAEGALRGHLDRDREASTGQGRDHAREVFDCDQPGIFTGHHEKVPETAPAQHVGLSDCLGDVELLAIHGVGIAKAAIQAVVDAVVRHVQGRIQQHRAACGTVPRGEVPVRDNPGRGFHGLQRASRIEAGFNLSTQRLGPSGRENRQQRARRAGLRAAQLVHQQVEPLRELRLIGAQMPRVVVEQLVTPAFDFLRQRRSLRRHQPRAVLQGPRDFGQQLQTHLGVVIHAEDQLLELAINGPRAGFADRHRWQDPIKDRSRGPAFLSRHGRGHDRPIETGCLRPL